MTYTGQRPGLRGRSEWPARSPVGAPPARARPEAQPPPLRTAHLLVRRIEPVSVLRMALVVAAGFVIAILVVVAALYGLLDVMGVFDTVGTFSKDIGATRTSTVPSPLDILGWTALAAGALAAVGVAAATVAAFAYNLVGRLVGGPELTLTERR